MEMAVIGVNSANIAFVTTDATSPAGTPGNARLKRDSWIRHFILMTQGHYLRLLMNGELLQVLSMKVHGKEDHINPKHMQ